MMHSSEIQPIQELANVVATLLNTGHPQAVDASMPILAMIKAQFPAEAAVEAQHGERVCGQVEAKYDPVAEAAAQVRQAEKEVDARQVEFRKARARQIKASDDLSHAKEDVGIAQNKLDELLRQNDRA